MSQLKNRLAVRIGLFLLSAAYFSFTFYEMTVALLHNGHPGTVAYWVWVTDTTGILGMGFRSAAGVIALITCLFFLVKRDLSRAEILMSIRIVILLEALYWFVSFFPSGLWGLTTLGTTLGANAQSLTFIVNTTIPCLFESIAIPTVFSLLFLKLNAKNLYSDAIKWGFAAGTIYIFVFWLDNFCNWAATVYMKGVSYITVFPNNAANLFSFAATSGGLLALALISSYLTLRIMRATGPIRVDLRKIGAIILFFGFYFEMIFMLWIYLGSVGGWSTWYAWFLGHNADLWLMMAPLVGISLFLESEKTKLYNWVVLSAQTVSIMFYGVFLAAYALALPTNNVLIDKTAYRTPLAVLGGLLILLILVCVILLIRTTINTRKSSS